MTEHKFTLSRPGRERIQREIEDCQKRITQVLVPTIVGFGLLGVSTFGAIESVEESTILIFLFAFLAVFVTSGLYITSLSYRIFRNAAFLRKFSEKEGDWERMLKKYNEVNPPRILDLETTTIGLIYTILAAMISLFVSYVVITAICNTHVILSYNLQFSEALLVGGVVGFGLFLLLYHSICKKMLKVRSFINEFDKKIGRFKDELDREEKTSNR